MLNGPLLAARLTHDRHEHDGAPWYCDDAARDTLGQAVWATAGGRDVVGGVKLGTAVIGGLLRAVALDEEPAARERLRKGGFTLLGVRPDEHRGNQKGMTAKTPLGGCR